MRYFRNTNPHRIAPPVEGAEDLFRVGAHGVTKATDAQAAALEGLNGVEEIDADAYEAGPKVPAERPKIAGPVTSSEVPTKGVTKEDLAAAVAEARADLEAAAVAKSVELDEREAALAEREREQAVTDRVAELSELSDAALAEREREQAVTDRVAELSELSDEDLDKSVEAAELKLPRRAGRDDKVAAVAAHQVEAESTEEAPSA